MTCKVCADTGAVSINQHGKIRPGIDYRYRVKSDDDPLHGGVGNLRIDACYVCSAEAERQWQKLVKDTFPPRQE